MLYCIKEKILPHCILGIAFGAIVIVALSLSAAAAEESATPAEAQKPAAKDTKDCLSYEPGMVTLKGQLHHFADEWELNLDVPVCINERENETALYPQMDVVKTVFVEPRRDDGADQYKAFTNADVVVTGTLYHKNFGPGTGNIMMIVSNIDLAKDAGNDGK